MTKSPSAAQLRRRATTSQGFRLSESEIAQKSWPKRRAEPRRRRLHRADARENLDVERAPDRLAGLGRLDQGRRHRENPRIAARDQRHVGALGGEGERVASPRDLLTIVAGVAALRGRERKAIEIRRIAEHVARAGERRIGFGRTPIRRAGPEPDHANAARAHGRRPSPGTSTIEK